MSSLWKNAASIFGYLVSSVSQMRATLVTSQSAGWVSSTWIFGIFLHHRLEAARAALRAGMAERALRHDHRALAADRVDQRLGDRGAHELVVGREEAVDVDAVERRDQRVHVDHRDAGVDHLVDRRGQRADAERLDGDEVPFLRGHVVDRGALLDGVELAVEPGHLDVEQLAPVFGRLLALRAPGRLQAGIGERRLQRLARPAGLLAHLLRQRRAYAEPRDCRPRLREEAPSIRARRHRRPPSLCRQRMPPSALEATTFSDQSWHVQAGATSGTVAPPGASSLLFVAFGPPRVGRPSSIVEVFP